MLQLGSILKASVLIVTAACMSFVMNTVAVKRLRVASVDTSSGLFTMHMKNQEVQLMADRKAAFTQEESNTCGPAAIRYLLSRYGTDYTEKEITDLIHPSKEGSSMLQMTEGLNKLGFTGTGIKVGYEKLMEMPKPLIAFINNNHYVVVTYVDEKGVYSFNPAPGKGLLFYTKGEFLKIWRGIILEVRFKPIQFKK